MAEEFLMKDHWETVYRKNSDNDVSWYQVNPAKSLELIGSLEPGAHAAIIDVGGGNSNLTGKLLEQGMTDLAVLDISAEALKSTRKKLGDRAEKVQWIVSDVLDFESSKRFDIWHDRAVFHFITGNDDVKQYAGILATHVKTGGHLIISTFALSGPKKCSGLKIRQYSAKMLQGIFEPEFKLCKHFEEVHTTPFNTTQNFTWCLFRRL